MDLWQVRRRYRQLGARLRRVEGNGPLKQAEEVVVASLLLADRLETELAVLRFARKCAQGRLGRVQAWLEHTALLKDAPRAVFNVAEEAELFLAKLGADSLAAALGQLQLELRTLDHRVSELHARITRLGEVASDHFATLDAHVRLNPG